MKTNKGFSVLELILSLLLMSVVLLSIYGAYFQFIYAQGKNQASAQHYIDMLSGLSQISRDMTNIVYFDFSLNYPDQLSMYGDEQSIFFFVKNGYSIDAVEYRAFSLDQIYQNSTDNIFRSFLDQTYSEILGKSYFVLVRRSSSYTNYLSSGAWEKERIVMPPVQSLEDLRWGYLVQDPEYDNDEWLKEWFEKTPPQAVGLRVNLAESAQELDPIELVWPIRQEINNDEE